MFPSFPGLSDGPRISETSPHVTASPSDRLRVSEVGRQLKLMQHLKCSVNMETLADQVLPGLQRYGSWDMVLYRLKEEGGVPYNFLAPALCKHLLKTKNLLMAVDVADRYA